MSSSEDDDFACVCCLSNILKTANVVKEARDSHPKWYQCPEGHLFCEKCYKLIGGESALCSVCRIAMGKVRNRFAENLFNKLISDAKSNQAEKSKPCISEKSGKLSSLPSPNPVKQKNSRDRGASERVDAKNNAKQSLPAKRSQGPKSKSQAPKSNFEFMISTPAFQSFVLRFQCTKTETLVIFIVFFLSILFLSTFVEKAIAVLSLSHSANVSSAAYLSVGANVSILDISQANLTFGNKTLGEILLSANDSSAPLLNAATNVSTLADNAQEENLSTADENTLYSMVDSQSSEVRSESESPSSNLSHFTENSRTVELTIAAPSAEISQYLPLAQRGDAEAQYMVGELLEAGWPDAPPNQGKAFEFFHLAAEQGLASAEYKVGEYFELGISPCEKNNAKALAHYRKAAKLSSSKAQVALGRFFKSGTGGVKKSEQTAVKYFQQAADQGEPLGQYHLAKLTKDKKESAKYMRLAAEQGLAIAQEALGRYYATGHGVPRDSVQAAKFYHLAADQGLPEAQLRMGAYYSQGIGGLEQNTDKGLHYFELSAAQGLKQAQFTLGLLYQDGMGSTKPDRQRALQLFQAAAEQGLADAQYVLASYYEQGIGGLKTNLKAAVELYRRSATQGNEKAIAAMQRLGRA